MECFKRNQHPQRPARLLVRPGGMLAFHSDPKKPTQSSRTTGSKSWDFPLVVSACVWRASLWWSAWSAAVASRPSETDKAAGFVGAGHADHRVQVSCGQQEGAG